MSDKGQLAVTHLRGNPVITQSPNGETSHVGSMSYDFAYGEHVVPIYAPFDMKCVAVDRAEAFTFWESLKEVQCADGTSSFVTFNTGHSHDHARHNVGDIVKKGKQYAYTGEAGNAQGDHTHIESAKRKFTTMWSGGSMPKPVHDYFDIFSTCDNVTKTKVKFTDQSGGNPSYKCLLDWVDGEGGNGNGDGGGGNNGNGSAKLNLPEITVLTQFEPKEHKVKGILKELERLIIDKTGIKTPSKQLLTNEFCSVFIEDFTGNKFQIDLDRLSETDKNTIIQQGVLADNNFNTLTLKELLSYSFDKVTSVNYANLSECFVDNSTRNISLISSQINNLMQSNSNSIDHQRATFRENKYVMDKQLALNSDRTQLAENRANYSSQYSVELANMGLMGSSFGLASSLIGTAMGGWRNPLGATGSLVGSGMGYMGSIKSLDNAKQQRDFTYQSNDLNNQQNALSSMATKQGYHQQIRGFNASIKDTKNKPDSLVQSGSDVAYLTGNKVDRYFISYYIPKKELLIQADNYIKMYGIVTNEIKSNIKNELTNIDNYKYIQCSVFEVDIVNISQFDYMALQSIFLTGTRLWKFDENIKERYLKYDTI